MASDSVKLSDSSLEMLQQFYEPCAILNTMAFVVVSLTMGPMKCSELLKLPSETKAQFIKVVEHFNLIKIYIQTPSKETANQLQILFDRGKSANCIVRTPDKVCKILGQLSTFLKRRSQNGELEAEGSGAQAMAESRSNKKLQDEITSLKTEKGEILEWVGEKEFNEAAQINEKRRSDLFQQIYRRPNKTPVNVQATVAALVQQRGAEDLVQNGDYQDANEIEDLHFPIQESDTSGRNDISLRSIQATLAMDEESPSFTNASNGSNRSEFQAHVTNQSQSDDNHLCSHYKRKCHVKFECCEEFWPCHRCHNAQSTCGQRKLNARDAKTVKCTFCHKKQQPGQFCCDCGAKFAEYFCCLCIHLTGTDDHPYHCEKCGICRVHGDCTFHCDTCGVCLDVQLRGNHICREGFAHDECCICLEDTFIGCQVLPCSHKVHKECANQMMLSVGKVCCPFCLDGNQQRNSRKRAE